MFETKIAKLKKVLTKQIKDFDDVKTELSRRIEIYDTYFEKVEKENVSLKYKLTSQNTLQKENNDLKMSHKRFF